MKTTKWEKVLEERIQELETFQKIREEKERGNPIANIDFTELRNQKRTLLRVIEETRESEIQDDLIGILHMIDAIQDYAVDELGWNQMMVYDFEDEENRED